MNPVGVGRLVERECVLDLDGPGLDVDDHQPGRQAIQDKHDLVQANGLAGVDSV